jgi:hypothetical protein
MAVTKMSECLKNATIDLDNDTITEVTKDGDLVYSLSKFLERWNKIDGLTINIGKNTDILPDVE